MAEKKDLSVSSREEMRTDELINYMKRGFIRTWWVPILLMLIGGGLLLFRERIRYTPYYEAKATIMISAVNVVAYEDGSGGVSSYYSKATASQMTEAFPYIISSSVFMNRLKNYLGTGYISSKITAENLNDTNFLTLKVRDVDPDTASLVLEGVIEVYPEIASYVVGETEMTMVLDPTVSSSPVNIFSAKRATALGAAVGLALYMVCLYIYGVTRNKIRSDKDIERKLNQQCLCSLPRSNINRRRHSSGIAVVMNNTTPMYTETVKLLASRIMQSSKKNGSKVFVITSTLPSEGKSTVSLNLSAALAIKGSKVLLVDADLRRQRISEMIGATEAHPGLTGVLRDGVSVKKAVFASEIPGLYYLCGAEKLQSPGRLIRSGGLDVLFEELRTEYDYIIVDTAPCGVISDAVVFCNYADRILYVIKKDGANIGSIINGIQNTSYSHAMLLGCVLNFSENRTASGYGYGNKYSYYAYSHNKKQNID